VEVKGTFVCIDGLMTVSYSVPSTSFSSSCLSESRTQGQRALELEVRGRLDSYLPLFYQYSLCTLCSLLNVKLQ